MAGIASPRSLIQYAAVARMRLQMMGHSVRTGRGRFDVLAQIATWGTYLFLGTVFAVAFGSGAYYLLRDKPIDDFNLVIWAALLMWQLTPLMAISFREEYDLSDLARYPLGFGAYYVLFLFFGFFDLSTIFGLAALSGISVGIFFARPGLLPIALLGLAVFAAFNILLNRAIFAWLDRWLAQRRSREMLGIFFFAIIVALELMNPALYPSHGHIPLQILQVLAILLPLTHLFPPGLVVGAMQAVAAHHLVDAAAALSVLLGWTVLPAVILGIRLRAQHRGENLSQAPAQKQKDPAAKNNTGASWLDVTGPIAAVMVKEAQYLKRSYQLLYGLVAPLLLMLVFTGSPHSHEGGPIAAPTHLLLPLAVVYSFLGLTRLVFNSLGGESSALQFYFYSPVPFWKVMLGKNLFHLILLGVEIIVLWIIAVLRVGLPATDSVVLTLCAMTFIVPANFLAANFVALYMPYRMNLSRIARAQGATANNMVSLLVQLVVAGIALLAGYVASAKGGIWLAAIVFLIMGFFTCLAYWTLLRGLGQRARRRVDILLNDLARTAN